MTRYPFMFAALILSLVYTDPMSVAHTSTPANKYGIDWDSIRHVIAFGDSYTFVQGSHGYPGYSFIGDQLNLGFDAEKLLSNKIIQNKTGTSAGGPNWIEHLTGCGVKEGLTAPLSCKRSLWNFAFAGAGISAEHIPLHHPYTIFLVNQIAQYATYAHPVLTSTSLNTSSSTPTSHDPHDPRKPILSTKETLIAIWIGINDINDSIDYATPAFYNTLLTTLFASLADLHNLGFRNYLILNLPPLHRTPSNQVLPETEQKPNATAVGWWNSALKSHSERFERENPGVNVLLFDAFSVLSGVLDEPGKYGILNTTSICPGVKEDDVDTGYEGYGCPTPVESYFWYDAGHIGERVHRVLARVVERGLRGWKGR
ncbi:hypothetical protein BJY04DRAFT_219195 [Aspergillus karnatakaensis]|uniref:SGNH/GDSL hydrolase family protein n=1 Tax=Aspergillus karnatakaensis TaxID=1810916 RepID=UPI003CCDAE67